MVLGNPSEQLFTCWLCNPGCFHLTMLSQPEQVLVKQSPSKHFFPESSAEAKKFHGTSYLWAEESMLRAWKWLHSLPSSHHNARFAPRQGQPRPWQAGTRRKWLRCLWNLNKHWDGAVWLGHFHAGRPQPSPLLYNCKASCRAFREPTSPSPVQFCFADNLAGLKFS